MTKLMTIGYEAASPEDFVASLHRAGVKQVIDIRELPQSRRRGFSKKQLSAILADEAISYVHIRQLGDPKHGRDAARSGRFEEFQQIYCAHLELSASIEALDEAGKLAKQTPSALLCYERDYKQCHRAIVAQKMSVLYSFFVEHMGVAHGEARRRNDGGHQAAKLTRASI